MIELQYNANHKILSAEIPLNAGLIDTNGKNHCNLLLQVILLAWMIDEFLNL